MLAAVTTHRLLTRPSAPRAASRPEPLPHPRAPLLFAPLTRVLKIKHHLVSRKTSVMPHRSPAGPQLALCLPVMCHEVLQRRVKPQCRKRCLHSAEGASAAGTWPRSCGPQAELKVPLGTANTCGEGRYARTCHSPPQTPETGRRRLRLRPGAEWIASEPPGGEGSAFTTPASRQPLGHRERSGFTAIESTLLSSSLAGRPGTG